MASPGTAVPEVEVMAKVSGRLRPVRNFDRSEPCSAGRGCTSSTCGPGGTSFSTPGSMWRGLETGLWPRLDGHEAGNDGHGQGVAYGEPRQSSIPPGCEVRLDPPLPEW